MSPSSSAASAADSVNRKLAEVLRDHAPDGVTVEIVDGLGEVPFYNQDLDTATDIPAAAARCASRSAPPTASSP